jgi:Ca-activated chloride channel homolog
MRKLLQSLVVVTLVAGGCASSSATYGPASAPDQQHHYPTAAPAATAPPYAAASPYGGVTFDNPGVNPVTDTTEDRQSTFAMDVDTASYTIAQRFVADGHVPDPASIRTEEWVNAFDQAYPAPDEDTFAVYVDGGPTPFVDRGETLLRIGIKARESSERARPAAALTFVIDTSGSMSLESRLELVKDSLRKLVLNLGPGDSIAVVTFGDQARVVLPPTRASDEETILAAIEQLQPGGSTNL